MMLLWKEWQKCGPTLLKQGKFFRFALLFETIFWVSKLNVFVSFRNPIPKTDNLLSAHWYPFTPASKEYLEIGDTLIPSNNLKANTMIFWDDVITKVLKKQGKLGKNFETSDLFNLSY